MAETVPTHCDPTHGTTDRVVGMPAGVTLTTADCVAQETYAGRRLWALEVALGTVMAMATGTCFAPADCRAGTDDAPAPHPASSNAPIVAVAFARISVRRS